MNHKLSDIKNVIKEDFEQFEIFFKSSIKTDNFLLNKVLKYIFKSKGKQIRPILVILSAKLAGEVNNKTYVAATLIELLHTATLVHDDVVDNSELRRGMFSLKSLWRSKLTVLVGDYLLSQGLLISIKNKTFDILEVVSDTVKEMSEGELLQIEKARKLDLNLENYFDIIGKKTASLIKASTKSGALSVTNNYEIVENISQIGWNLGIAFQIKDDLFDYENSSVIGKPGANDIQESKVTLPVIFYINELSKNEKKEFLRIFSKKNKSNLEINKIKTLILDSKAMDKAKESMNYYIKQAKELLSSNFNNSKVFENYNILIDYIIQRKK